MEGVGARLGRSSTRYGPTTVFTGPVRKWKKKWIHVTPPNTTTTAASGSNHHHQTTISSNGNSSSSGNNDNGSHLMLYKWTPITQPETQDAAADNDSNVDAKDDGTAADVDEEPPRRKIKYIPIALLEEQKKESPEENIDESVETSPNLKVDGVNGKPGIDDVPMEENEVSGKANLGRQDLNESTLDLNARDGDEDLEETKDET